MCQKKWYLLPVQIHWNRWIRYCHDRKCEINGWQSWLDLLWVKYANTFDGVGSWKVPLLDIHLKTFGTILCKYRKKCNFWCLSMNVLRYLDSKIESKKKREFLRIFWTFAKVSSIGLESTLTYFFVEYWKESLFFQLSFLACSNLYNGQIFCKSLGKTMKI